MDNTDLITSLFHDVDDAVLSTFDLLAKSFTAWNEKINLVSRKDIQHLYEKHIVHSLLIAKWIQFVPGSKILDVGTGGGFPGIPLAILFPEVSFHLVDSTRKKINVVQAIQEELGLKNVRAEQIRAEELKGQYDFVLARAVAPTERIIQWTQKLISDKHLNQVPNGWLLLKGGDLREELKAIPRGYYVEKTALKEYLTAPYFAEKFLIYIQK